MADTPNGQKRPTLTTSAGAPVADNQNAITAGPRGPVLLQDYQLIEKLAHQNRERIPERTVHAKGWGAYGTLTITGDVSRYTKAKCLQPGATTDMIARFSTASAASRPAENEVSEASRWSTTGNSRTASAWSSMWARRVRDEAVARSRADRRPACAWFH